MACHCHRVCSTLACTQCGRTQTIRHRESENALETAKRQHRVCGSCGTNTFSIVSSQECEQTKGTML